MFTILWNYMVFHCFRYVGYILWNYINIRFQHNEIIFGIDQYIDIVSKKKHKNRAYLQTITVFVGFEINSYSKIQQKFLLEIYVKIV